VYSDRSLPALFRNIAEFLPGYTTGVTSQKVIVFIKWLSRVVVKTLHYLFSVLGECSISFVVQYPTSVGEEWTYEMRNHLFMPCSKVSKKSSYNFLKISYEKMRADQAGLSFSIQCEALKN
jgi:hypothetical protein